MTINHLTVLGAGVLGAQIAFQAAFHGIKTVSYDINDDALATAKKRFDDLARDYRRDLNADDKAIEAAFANLTQSCDLAEAVKDADIIIEAVPEKLELKKETWEKVGKLAKKDCIFTTNTSTLLPSEFADSSGDASRFLALHFANIIWVRNVVEVMGTPKTSPEVIEKTEKFAKKMGMQPIVLQKEQPGYIINSLLVPLLEAATHLMAKEVAGPKDIDRVWEIASGSPHGPFASMDVIGLRTVYNIHSAKAEAKGDELAKKFTEILKSEYLDKGRLGKEVGKGFYDYDEQGNIIK